MAAGSQSATSTYVPGSGINFGGIVASKVLAAAQAAKDEKKFQEKLEAKGGEVPDSAKKGLFVKALKQQFISNPIKDIKKSLNKKIESGANFVGFFGKKGRKLEDKILAKRFSIKKGGFDRSGYKSSQKDDEETPSGGMGGGGGGSVVINSLGEIVTDIQAIANSLSGLTSLFNKQLGTIYKVSGSLAELKQIISKQFEVQQEQAQEQKLQAAEASLEQSNVSGGTSSATSTFVPGSGFNIAGILEAFNGIKSFFKMLPETIGNALKGILQKIPGGGRILKMFGGAAEGAAAGAAEGAAAGAGGFFKGFLRPILKRIPIFGGIIDFFVSLAMGEPIDRAIAKSVGSMLGGALFGLLSAPLPFLEPFALVGGGVLGDFLGGWLFDRAKDMMAGNQKKMAAGGVMIGEAGPEMVTSLHSADGKKMLGGDNTALNDAYQQPYNAAAGGMLAVTKDFVEGLGPVGQSVAPVIEQDVDKLGRVFDIPATATKIDVGGASLKKNPNAQKEGEKYMEELVKGSLEKLQPNKKKENAGGGGGGGGGGDALPDDTNPDTPSPTGAPPGGPPGEQPPQKTTLQNLQENVNFVDKQVDNGGVKRVISAVTGTNKAGVKRVKMVDWGGQLSDKYYYDNTGKVFFIDPTLGQKSIKEVSTSELKQGLGDAGKFYRNLTTGEVVVTNAPPIGFYNYEKNGVVKNQQGQGLAHDTVITTPISNLNPNEKKNFGDKPYGPDIDISKIKAESGIAITSRRGQRILNGSRQMHEGTDIAAPTGTKLYAFADGIIKDKRESGHHDGGYGNSIYWVEKTTGIGHLYAHMSAFGKNTEVNTQIKKGKILGTVGSTGESSGPHLHWEMADNPRMLGLPPGTGDRKDPLSKYSYMTPFTGTPKPGDGLDNSTQIDPSGANDKEKTESTDPVQDTLNFLQSLSSAVTKAYGLMSKEPTIPTTSPIPFQPLKAPTGAAPSAGLTQPALIPVPVNNGSGVLSLPSTTEHMGFSPYGGSSMADPLSTAASLTPYSLLGS